jgi:hypothetical protein
MVVKVLMPATNISGQDMGFRFVYQVSVAIALFLGNGL